MDAKIAPVVQAQLRRLLPNHGFRLIKIKSDRVVVNGAVKCDLGAGYVATAHLSNPLDPNGKVQMRFELTQHDVSQFQTIVATPPDQFNFFDKAPATATASSSVSGRAERNPAIHRSTCRVDTCPGTV